MFDKCIILFEVLKVGRTITTHVGLSSKMRLTSKGAQMKLAATKNILWGLFMWVMVFGIIGGATASKDFAVKQTGAILCPANTTPDTTTYQGTRTDSDGRTVSDTKYILQCKDANGTVVLENDMSFMFLWVGMVAGLGLVLAAPIVLIALLVVLMKKNK